MPVYRNPFQKGRLIIKFSVSEICGRQISCFITIECQSHISKEQVILKNFWSAEYGHPEGTPISSKSG